MTCTKCQNPAFSRGMCRTHYARAWRAGLEPLVRPECKVDFCDRPHKGHDLCALHLVRHRRGNPMNGPLRKPSAYRYVIVTRRDHPLAMKNGRVAVHRMVLFDAVRGGRLPCFWCGTPLAWNVDRKDPNALYVDHLNHNRRCNEDTNLVPSCNSCNAGRMRPDQLQSVYSSEKVGS